MKQAFNSFDGDAIVVREKIKRKGVEGRQKKTGRKRKIEEEIAEKRLEERGL